MENEVLNAYRKLARNSFYVSEMRPYLLAEVRELAVQISMKKLDLWDKMCQVESNIKQTLPEAIKEGYGEDVLKYHLAHDQEYCEAEAIIKLIEDPQIKTELVTLEGKKNGSKRLSVAFCIYMLYKESKFDISTLSKNAIYEIVRNHFKGFASAITIKDTLLGYNRNVEEKGFFKYEHRKWIFRDDNFNYMKNLYMDDYNKGLEMFEKLK